LPAAAAAAVVGLPLATFSFVVVVISGPAPAAVFFLEEEAVPPPLLLPLPIPSMPFKAAVASFTDWSFFVFGSVILEYKYSPPQPEQ